MPLSKSQCKAKIDRLKRKIENTSFKDLEPLALLNIARSAFNIFMETESTAGAVPDTSKPTVKLPDPQDVNDVVSHILASPSEIFSVKSGARVVCPLMPH